MLLAKEPLRFVFSGYSVWLELEQYQDDLDRVCAESKERLGLPHGVPEPHVTAIYGMTHLSEQEARKKLQQVAEDVQDWPILEHKGFVNDIELEGVNGGAMDMAWMEGTFATNEKHEFYLDLLYNAFFDLDLDNPVEDTKQKRAPWAPHVSFAYDNEFNPIPDEVLYQLIEEYPTLKNNRNVKGISLWSTEGTIDQWKCIDRVCFNKDYANAALDALPPQ
eukprot:scaffold6966_cov112-Cylindrotheca_fusiformis.AAC.19